MRSHPAGNRVGRRIAGASAVLAVAFFLIAGSIDPTQAQEETEPARAVQVGLYVSPPFVIETAGDYSGMAIELWETIAEPLNLTSDYQLFPTIGALVNAAAGGEIDVAVTNLTITRNRAQRIDFTQPWFDAGLRIMVNDERQAGFMEVMQGLSDAGHLRAYAWLAGVIIAATLLMTLFDRHFDKDFPQRWRDGVAESFYSVMSIATSGKSPARKNLFGWIGRMWQGLWLVCGVAVLAYATSTVTSVMTTLSLTNEINSVADLPGKTVGVFTGSVAEDFARESMLSAHSFANIDEAVQALLQGRVAAIVGDAPVLEYYAHTHPEATVSVVGAIFEPDKYGFGLVRGSPLGREVTLELLGTRERGLVEEMRTKYFGDAP